jgi:hypothetical protein
VTRDRRVSYAFTAGSTVPRTNAESGATLVSGYVLSTLHYQVNATDPLTVDGVTFTLSSAPKAGSKIQLQLVSGTPGTWFTCSNSGTSVSCTTTGQSLTTINTFGVVVAD